MVLRSAQPLKRIVASAVFVALLCGCGRPVPPEKSAYVGEWQATTMYLVITEDGSVRYKRLKGGASTTIDAPLKRFEGDNFAVGIGPLSTVFVVSRPPFRDGDSWKMVVDGVELTRSAGEP